MPKTFYTERDIEDLFRQGVTALEVDEDVVLTDLARERARSLGMELVQPHDKPPAAPERPYIAKLPSPSAVVKPAAPPPQRDLRARVRKAVMARLGNSVDPKLLDAIIDRVLQNIRTG